MTDIQPRLTERMNIRLGTCVTRRTSQHSLQADKSSNALPISPHCTKYFYVHKCICQNSANVVVVLEVCLKECWSLQHSLLGFSYLQPCYYLSKKTGSRAMLRWVFHHLPKKLSRIFSSQNRRHSIPQVFVSGMQYILHEYFLGGP